MFVFWFLTITQEERGSLIRASRISLQCKDGAIILTQEEKKKRKLNFKKISDWRRDKARVIGQKMSFFQIGLSGKLCWAAQVPCILSTFDITLFNYIFSRTSVFIMLFANVLQCKENIIRMPDHVLSFNLNIVFSPLWFVIFKSQN